MDGNSVCEPNTIHLLSLVVGIIIAYFFMQHRFIYASQPTVSSHGNPINQTNKIRKEKT